MENELFSLHLYIVLPLVAVSDCTVPECGNLTSLLCDNVWAVFSRHNVVIAKQTLENKRYNASRLNDCKQNSKINTLYNVKFPEEE